MYPLYRILLRIHSIVCIVLFGFLSLVWSALSHSPPYPAGVFRFLNGKKFIHNIFNTNNTRFTTRRQIRIIQGRLALQMARPKAKLKLSMKLKPFWVPSAACSLAYV